jgi:hypothetical protein
MLLRVRFAHWNDSAFSQTLCRFHAASQPKCILNAISSQQQILVNEFDELQVTCDVNYTGNWQPIFVCQPEVVQTSSFAISSADDVVQYVGTVNVTHTFNQRSIACKLNFLQNDFSSTSVSASDQDFHVWTSPMLNVTCKYSLRY